MYGKNKKIPEMAKESLQGFFSISGKKRFVFLCILFNIILIIQKMNIQYLEA
jgi:hypothetical protein